MDVVNVESANLDDLKKRFVEICATINRPGMEDLMAWLERSDFYTAPASTRFHGNYTGGLLEHKLIASMTDTVRKYGARCLILDNFMCIDTETSEEELRSQTDTIKKLIEFAKKYQVAVILVCHPRKMDAGTNVGIYDIAGTSNIVNLAHRTIGLRRVTDAERENAAKYSEKRRQLLKYDVIVTMPGFVKPTRKVVNIEDAFGELIGKKLI